jgi:RimJ/RimL family protein N-acetyltransferase
LRSASGAGFRVVVNPGRQRDYGLRTQRLVLRPWRDEDREPFAALNADAQVMEHFPAALTRAQSDELADRIDARFAAQGYGLWAVEIPGETPFIGFVGLMHVPEEMPFAPALEVGWRLARPYWGRGLAHEGAQAAIDFAFAQLGLDEVVAYTARRNLRSRRLMERLGMRHDAGADFDHPGIEPTSPLQPHVLYRLPRNP